MGNFNRCPISSLLRHFSLKKIVKAPTRNEATLDFILTNMSDVCSPVSIIAPVGRSDHNSVLFSLQKINRQNQHNKVIIRQGNVSAKHAFSESRTKVNWLGLYQTVSCETKLNMFHNVIESRLDYFLPKKSVKLHTSDKPWIIPNYKNLIAKRQKAFRQGNCALYNSEINVLESVKD